MQARGNISSGRPRTFAHSITSSNACWPNGRATHMLQTDHSRIRCSTNDSRHKADLNIYQSSAHSITWANPQVLRTHRRRDPNVPASAQAQSDKPRTRNFVTKHTHCSEGSQCSSIHADNRRKRTCVTCDEEHFRSHKHIRCMQTRARVRWVK